MSIGKDVLKSVFMRRVTKMTHRNGVVVDLNLLVSQDKGVLPKSCAVLKGKNLHLGEQILYLRVDEAN